jgi:hypothetical protein
VVDEPGPPPAVAGLADHGHRIHDLTPAGPRQVAVDRVGAITNQRRSLRRADGEVLASSARSDAEIAALARSVAALPRWAG